MFDIPSGVAQLAAQAAEYASRMQRQFYEMVFYGRTLSEQLTPQQLAELQAAEPTQYVYTGLPFGFRQFTEHLTNNNMPTANQPMPAIPADYNYNAATAYMRSATEVAVEEMQDGAALQQQMEDYRRRARALAQERMEAMHPPAVALGGFDREMQRIIRGAVADDAGHDQATRAQDIREMRSIAERGIAHAQERLEQLRQQQPLAPVYWDDLAIMAPTRDTPPSPDPFPPTNNHLQTEQEMARNTRTQHEEPVVVRTVAVKAQTPDIASTVDINEWRNFCSSMSAVKEPAKPSSPTEVEVTPRPPARRPSWLRPLRIGRADDIPDHQTVRHDDTGDQAPW